jgi:hypothetical protein
MPEKLIGGARKVKRETGVSSNAEAQGDAE